MRLGTNVLIQLTIPGIWCRISEEEVRRYEEDGATVVRQLFPPEWLDELRAAAEENMKNPGLIFIL